MKPCVLVPIFDHGDPVVEVLAGLEPTGIPCLVVDDGSGAATREALANAERRFPFVEVVRRPEQGGKGAALKTGYRAAAARGFSHVVQLDADGQHDPGDVPRFVEAMDRSPDALVLGTPVFDESVPLARLYARQISRVLVWVACLSRVVSDPLCGFRGIPLGPTLALLDAVRTGDWMDFDPELAVRLVWAGLPVVSLPTRVVYFPGGISHFDVLRDYARLTWLYTRLVGGMPLRAASLLRARRARRIEGASVGNPSAESGWSSVAERGSFAAMRAMAWIYRVLGRRLAQTLLYPIVLYFFLRERESRQASRRYLEALWERPEGRRNLAPRLASGARRPGLLAPLRHFHEFAVQIFDRMVLWGGGLDRFRMDSAGGRHLFALADSGRGGILLGSHLGSFDMARQFANVHGLRLNVVMFTAHAQRINHFFEQLDPKSSVRVLELDPGSVKTAFAIKSCLDRGELVAILADRIPAASRERPVEVPFLGRPALFPRSPFQLACLLGCPVLVSLCVRVGNAHYRTSVEPLSDGRRLPRRERDKGAEELCRAYVARLEAACERYPYQWFNFHDLWEDARP